jgi:hypothetical protein
MTFLPAPFGACGFRLERIGVVAVKEMAQNNGCQGREREYKAPQPSSVTCSSQNRDQHMKVASVFLCFCLADATLRNVVKVSLTLEHANG